MPDSPVSNLVLQATAIEAGDLIYLSKNVSGTQTDAKLENTDLRTTLGLVGTGDYLSKYKSDGTFGEDSRVFQDASGQLGIGINSGIDGFLHVKQDTTSIPTLARVESIGSNPSGMAIGNFGGEFYIGQQINDAPVYGEGFRANFQTGYLFRFGSTGTQSMPYANVNFENFGQDVNMQLMTNTANQGAYYMTNNSKKAGTVFNKFGFENDLTFEIDGLNVGRFGCEGGFLPTELTTTERDAITAPITGSIIYNSTTSQHEQYNGTAWISLGGGTDTNLGNTNQNITGSLTRTVTQNGNDIGYDGRSVYGTGAYPLDTAIMVRQGYSTGVAIQGDFATRALDVTNTVAGSIALQTSRGNVGLNLGDLPNTDENRTYIGGFGDASYRLSVVGSLGNQKVNGLFANVGGTSGANVTAGYFQAVGDATNIAMRLEAQLGTTNRALQTGNGDVWLNGSNGYTTSVGTVSPLSTTKVLVTGNTSDFTENNIWLRNLLNTSLFRVTNDGKFGMGLNTNALSSVDVNIAGTSTSQTVNVEGNGLSNQALRAGNSNGKDAFLASSGNLTDVGTAITTYFGNNFFNRFGGVSGFGTIVGGTRLTANTNEAQGITRAFIASASGTGNLVGIQSSVTSGAISKAALFSVTSATTPVSLECQNGRVYLNTSNLGGAGNSRTYVGFGVGAVEDARFNVVASPDDTNIARFRTDSTNGSKDHLIVVKDSLRSVNMPNLPTGITGLSTGDLYLDTPANIATNGDLVIGVRS